MQHRAEVKTRERSNYQKVYLQVAAAEGGSGMRWNSWMPQRLLELGSPEWKVRRE